MSRFLSGIFGSLMKAQPAVEKRLKNTCFLKENFEEIDYDDLLKILSFLQGRTEVKQHEAITEFFTHIRECGDLSLQRRLKYLALIHKSIKKLGFEFAEDFLACRLNNLREKQVAQNAATTSNSGGKSSAQNAQLQQNQKSKAAMVFQYMDIESWLEEYVVKHYYDYLMRMSLNLETYKTCLLNEKEPGIAGGTGSGHQAFQAGNPLRMMVLFKVSNLVNFVMKLQKQFAIIFSEFKFIAIAKDIAYMVLKDCVIYYNYMHRQIMNMVTNYESMVENDQMQFYELFIELIKLNSALHDFGKLRKFFDDDESIEQPLVLNITKERARQIDRNHRKIVLKNEEIQRDRKLKLQQQMNGGAGGGANGSTSGITTGSKKLGVFPKQSGSMTSRGLNWKQNEQICEVTNEDEEEDFKTRFQKKAGNLFKKTTVGQLPSADGGVAGGNVVGSSGMGTATTTTTSTGMKVPGLNLENMYVLEAKEEREDVLGGNCGGGGFHTDRVVYSNHFKGTAQSESNHEDEERSESTKETTKKDHSFTKSSKQSKHQIQEQ